jgi:hypothetical protein
MAGENPVGISFSNISSILSAAALGIAAMMGTTWLANPGGDSAAKSGSPVVVGGQHVPTDELREQHHLMRMRAPLYDFVGLEPHLEDPPTSTLWSWLGLDAAKVTAKAPNPINSKTSASSVPPSPQRPPLHPELLKRLKNFELQFLVMTVADPIDSVNSSFFDHQLDALQKAMVAEPNDSWLYSGGYLPWQAFKDQRSVSNTVPLMRRKHWYQDEPGVLIFRKEAKKQSQDQSSKQAHSVKQVQKDCILLVYLVGELPTLGVQRDALERTILEIGDLIKQTHPATTSNSDVHEPNKIRIIGPTFTGGAFSLKAGLTSALHELNQKTKTQNFSAEIMNGSATAIPNDYFDDNPTYSKSKTPKSNAKKVINYRGKTLCGYEQTLSTLSQVAGNNQVVWLTETGTGFSSAAKLSFSAPKRTNDVADPPAGNAFDWQNLLDKRKNDLFIPVPVGISRVRASFEQHLTAAKQQSVGLPLIETTSPLPFDPDETAHDVPTIQTPQITAPAVELLLNEIMRTILVKQVSFVGLMATDVRDTIFLAEMLKLRCPHVQLLIAESDVLLSHPSYTDSLRGAVVASSYPHFPEGIEACRYGTSLPVMGGPAQYGIYNAILLQRGLARRNSGLTQDEHSGRYQIENFPEHIDQTFTGKNLVGLFAEQKLIDNDGTAESLTIGPQVWLHTVGYDRFYPRGIWHHPRDQAQSHHSLLQIESSHWLDHSGFEFRVNPGWYALAIAVILLWGAMIWTRSGRAVPGSFFDPLTYCSEAQIYWRRFFYIVFVLLFGVATAMLLSSLFVFHFYRYHTVLGWLAESYLFSGVSVQLPLFCSCAAGMTMCYLKLRQSYLICTRSVQEDKLLNQQPECEKFWICGAETDSGLPPRMAWLSVCVIGPTFFLGVIFTWTHDNSTLPYAFWSTWFIIAGGYILWWLAAFELFAFQRQLRDVAKKARDSGRLRGYVLTHLHQHGLTGVYRLLFGPGPSDYDAVATYQYKSPDVMETLKFFRELEYRFVIIKNQIYLLVLGALLLFCAVVSYPFTSEVMMRSLATGTILTLVGSVCVCFWKLEQDQHLSHILGTKPNEFTWDFKNLSVFVTYGLIAILVLLSQVVPGSWMTIGRVLGPLLHLGH